MWRPVPARAGDGALLLADVSGRRVARAARDDAGVIGYASRTGTRRNLAALRAAGWRLMVTPATLRTEGMRYALDNGAWSAAQQGTPWDADRFLRAVRELGPGADFIVVPDVVGDGPASLARSRVWYPFLLGRARLLLVAVQDGMKPADVRPMLGASVGLFVGGTTAWKLRTLGVWGQLAAEVGCYLHVGRVNTARRIARCAASGAHSFDGTSVTRYAVTAPKLEEARRQGGLRLYA
jgi:hypothetical protein